MSSKNKSLNDYRPKQKNKFFIGIIALVLSMLVGLSFFSHTITINGTAIAKGNYSTNIVCYEGLSPSIKGMYNEFYELNGSEYNTDEGGYSNDFCSVERNKVSVSVSLLYPKALRRFTIEAKNTGNVEQYYIVPPNKYVVPEKVLETQKLFDKETNKLVSTYSYSNYSDADKNYGVFSSVNGAYILDSSSRPITNKNDLNSEEVLIKKQRFYKDSNGILYLEVKPGETLVFMMSAYWDEEAQHTNYYSVTTLEAEIKSYQYQSDMALEKNPETCFSGC